MVNAGELPLTLIRGIEFDGILLQCRDDTVEVTLSSGISSPSAVGTYVPSGTFASYPLFILSGSPSYFVYYNTAAASYIIAGLLTNAAVGNSWIPASPLLEPTGTYLPHGENTGTLAATDNPVDLTGFGVEAKVRRTDKAEVYIDLDPSITDFAGGEITIPAISSDDTEALEFTGNFKWDLILTQGDERFGPYVKGSFVISDNITQVVSPSP